jgi:4-carboxymuconolactone decarboxylase
MSRLQQWDPYGLTDKQQTLYDSIASGPRGKFGGPFLALIHAPEIADKIQDLGATLRFNGNLPITLREVAILSVARHWENEVEWNAHVVIAQKEGLCADIIEDILLQRTDGHTDDKTNIVLKLCSQLQSNHVIDDETYTNAVTLLGTAQVVELISVVGYFTTLSMLLNSFQIEADGKDGIPSENLKLKTHNKT